MTDAPDETALRAEHDALAAGLAARRSIELVRRGAFYGFFGLVTGGLSGKLAYDRWVSTSAVRFKLPPMVFVVAGVLTSVLLTVAAVDLIRARRVMRQEDAVFARVRELRDRLGLDR